MITFNNTRTITELVKNVGKEYENNVFARYEKDDVIFEKGYGTYSLDTLAVAAYIESLNEKMGHRIHAAILGKCSYEYLTVLLGVPCAGGISIPLDVQLSPEKMKENLVKADTDVLFYDREFSSQADLIKRKCPFIKRFICLQSRKNTRCVPMIHKVYRGEMLKTVVKADECAMIIFTSGTTGHGKGVMLSHANIIDNMFCTDDDREVCLNVLPIHHIFCISGDVMIVLRYGGTLCICDDLSKMLYYLKLFQPTMMRAVPMMAKMLVNRVTILKKQYPDKTVSEVKEMVFGKRMKKFVSGGGYLSEALSSALLDLGIVTGQGYGMSECSPKISVPDYSRKDKVASVGHLVTGCQARIVENEIQVKSPSVMMGYYNDEELTREAITEDGWLCTGDLGYLDDEGFLYLNGRKKNLIILGNGENVSPEMIENLFDGDRLVQNILVYGKDEIIAAEIYPNYEYAQVNGITDIKKALDEIIAVHNNELPSYAKIAECTIRNTPFEMTSSKKIIRKIYFEEETKKVARKDAARKPENELQQKIYELVSREIGNTEFGIDENLFQSGLDSMGCTMLIADICDELQKSITLSELMDNPSVMELEELLVAKEKAEKTTFEVRDVYPLTMMQKYFAYIIPGNTTGNIPVAFKFKKDVNLERLKAAIYKVLDAHPALKAIVKPTEQRYYAIFRDDSRIIDIPIEKIDDAVAEQKIQELIVPFSFRENDNLVHIRLFEGQNYNYMFFDVAHFMSDGVTVNILMEDLKKAYDNEEIEAETYTGYDYILEEQLREKNGIRQKDVAYYTNLMKDLKMEHSILTKPVQGDLSVGEYGVIRKRMEKIARKNVLYYGKKNGVSENAMFVAAFNYCISLFSNDDDVFCSSIHSGRTDSRWNRIACALFENYYCRYKKVPHQTVGDMLKLTGKQIMNTMKCLTNVPRSGDMFFQFQGDIINFPEVGGDDTERIHVQLDSLPFHMQIMYDEKGYYTELRYWENRFDRASLEVFFSCYEEIIKAMLDEPSARCLKKHISQELFPKHYFATADALNRSAGYEIIQNVESDERIRVYVLDDEYNKKPFGAWGKVYFMNYEPANCTESLQYPYGVGVIYGTGLEGRIMPDGSFNFRNETGKIVVSEGIRGRQFYDIKKSEETLLAYEGINSAHCYMAYDNTINEMALFADINADTEIDADALREYVKANAGDNQVPKYINLI